MIGSGGVKDKEEVMKLANENHVENQIYMLDSVSNDELPLYYSMVDVFCTPSRWEGFGIVFIEALAMGTVTITSNISPMNLYIKNDFNGILVTDYENPLKLSQAIVKGVRNEDVRGVLIKNARQSIQKFSRKNVDKWEMALMKYFLYKTYGEGSSDTVVDKDRFLNLVEMAKKKMLG